MKVSGAKKKEVVVAARGEVNDEVWAAENVKPSMKMAIRGKYMLDFTVENDYKLNEVL